MSVLVVLFHAAWPCVVTFLAVLAIVWLLGKLLGDDLPPSYGCALALALLGSLLTPAKGAGQSIAPGVAGGNDASGRFAWHQYALTGRLFQSGEDRRIYVGARIDARLALPLGLDAIARADASAQRDGGAVDIEDPSTFSSFELTGGVVRPVTSSIGPALLYGWTIPIESGRPALIERYPRRVLAGVMGRGSLGWAVAGVGTDEASGRGKRFLFAGQAHVTGRTYVGADGALPGLVRTYVLVRLGEE